ncbi:MAG: hypothetical protein JXB05_13095 [Myxococcaceae bacterium]|nr:hypothetical protein [Myxococcaceae bacterium]
MQTRTARTSDIRGGQQGAGAFAASLNALLAKFLPTGASAATARQDGLSGGICASHRMARTDLPELQKYKAAFEIAAVKHGLPPALLAAIASRESRAGVALDTTGRRSGGRGFGLMQLEARHLPRGAPCSAEHIDQAAGLLGQMLGEVRRKHPRWPVEQQIRGAVVAYDSGVGNVRTITDMDRGTSGEDYSNDVWARAQALVLHFGGAVDPSASPEATRPAVGTLRFLREGGLLRAVFIPS